MTMTRQLAVTSLLLVLSIVCSSTSAHIGNSTSCGPGMRQCGPAAQRRCIPERWVCDGDNDCGDNSDEQDCASCRPGLAECGPGARRRCIPERWVCDGDNDCGDSSDEQDCETRPCPSEYVRCGGQSPSRRCIRESWLCDGDNDCGNYWDEERDECPVLSCRPGTIPCPGGRRRCISEYWLCDGDNDCGDNSDEDPETCRNNGAAQVRLCTREALLPCSRVAYAQYQGLSFPQVIEKLRNTDLRETCGPQLEAQQCISTAMSSPQCQFTDTDHPRVIDLQRQIAMMNTGVDFICRDNVDVFNEHKECLLRSGANGTNILNTIHLQCFRGNYSRPAQPHCPPPQMLQCAANVVSAQCGEEITSYLRTLGSKILEDLGCTAHRQPEMLKKEMKETMTKKGKTMKKEMKKEMYPMNEIFSWLF